MINTVLNLQNKTKEKYTKFDIEAEQLVIGTILVKDRLLSKIKYMLDFKDFYSSIHQYIYKNMLKMHKKDIPIDLVSIKDYININKIPGGIIYLADLATQVVIPDNVFYYAEKIKFYSLKRQIMELNGYSSINDILQIVNNTELSVYRGKYRVDLKNIFKSKEVTKEREILPGIFKQSVVSLSSENGPTNLYFCLEMAVTLITGGKINLLGILVPGYKRKVGYILLKTPMETIKSSIKNVLSKIKPDFWNDIFENLNIYILRGKNAIILDSYKRKNNKWINFYKKIAAENDMIIIDSLKHLHFGDENNYTDMNNLAGLLEEIAVEGDSVIMLDSCKKESMICNFVRRLSIISSLQGKYIKGL